MYLQRRLFEDMDWIHLAQGKFQWLPLMDTNELPCIVNDAEFIGQMGDYQLLKRIVLVDFCVLLKYVF